MENQHPWKENQWINICQVNRWRHCSLPLIHQYERTSDKEWQKECHPSWCLSMHFQYVLLISVLVAWSLSHNCLQMMLPPIIDVLDVVTLLLYVNVMPISEHMSSENGLKLSVNEDAHELFGIWSWSVRSCSKMLFVTEV